MHKNRILKGKKILIVDDEKDVLDVLMDLLDICKIDAATSFEEGKQLLETGSYDIAVLDIMGVQGYELLGIANERGIPSIMLTAHALSPEDLKKSAENGALYYAPKEEMKNIGIFVADVLEAVEKKKNAWVKWFARLGSFYDKRFGGTDWREKEKDFWEKKLDEYKGL